MHIYKHVNWVCIVHYSKADSAYLLCSTLELKVGIMIGF